MFGLFCFVLAVLASPFKSKIRLEAENAVLLHQLIVLRRRVRGRVRLSNNDRWFLIQLYRWFPSILQVLTIVQPETLVRWHRAGFRCYWQKDKLVRHIVYCLCGNSTAVCACIAQNAGPCRQTSPHYYARRIVESLAYSFAAFHDVEMSWDAAHLKSVVFSLLVGTNKVANFFAKKA